ncbi:MAG: amidohydrolase family protein, partial [Planctomycetota bacterium]|nr:amidohydrolase family protein [Planctomycetota bacterium]
MILSRRAFLGWLNATLSSLILCTLAIAQPAPTGAVSGQGPLYPPPNGMREVGPRWHAITGVTLHAAPDKTIDNATIVFRDGVITAVGEGLAAPDGARVHAMPGMHVYAGFIDPFVEVDTPQPDASAPGRHWNSKVTPQRDVLSGAGLPNDSAERLRTLGFTSAVITPKDGIFRGSAALVPLAPTPADRSVARINAYTPRLANVLALEINSDNDDKPAYPDSQMGAIALARQTIMDAAWQKAKGLKAGPDACAALESLENSETPLWMVASDELEILRLGKVAREAGRSGVFVGSGTEFRRLGAIAALKTPLIVPLVFPEAPDLGGVAEQDRVELGTLMTWEQAPTNPRRLDDAGVQVALTASGIKDPDEWKRNLGLALRHGLKPARALAMLTTSAAQIVGQSQTLGTVETGKRANLVIADGDLFRVPPKEDAPETKTDDKADKKKDAAPVANAAASADAKPEAKANDKASDKQESKPAKPRDAQVLGVWIDGAYFDVRAPKAILAGTWKVEVPNAPPAARTFEIDHDMKLVVTRDGKKTDAQNVRLESGVLSFTFDHTPLGAATGVHAITATLPDADSGPVDTLVGTGIRPDGARFAFTARREPPAASEPPAPEKIELETVPEKLPVPFSPYGLLEQPPVAHVVLRNATLWTGESAGVINNGEVELKDGHIVYVGGVRELTPPGATIVDCTGKHISAGIIDCHSHTGISKGVNEAGMAVTCQVRIADVTNPDTISWYRQLASGVTTVNSLHGSANAIGGQSQTNKVRWGCAEPDDMHFDGAKPGVKFALGENPKYGNSGTAGTDHYPQTRMGVEALIRDRLNAARDYMARLDDARRDLQLEALAQILRGERIIHCHSYRQDEIEMLCHVAKEYGFKIGTFQHILEGYKVADLVRDWSGGGSAFAEWWAYK